MTDWDQVERTAGILRISAVDSPSGCKLMDEWRKVLASKGADVSNLVSLADIAGLVGVRPEEAGDRLDEIHLRVYHWGTQRPAPAAEGASEMLAPEWELVLRRVHSFVRSNPEQFREAGEWIDREYSEAAVRERRKRHDNGERTGFVSASQMPGPSPGRDTRLWRINCVGVDLRNNPPDLSLRALATSEEKVSLARRVLLFVCVATDECAGEYASGLTQLATLSWIGDGVPDGIGRGWHGLDDLWKRSAPWDRLVPAALELAGAPTPLPRGILEAKPVTAQVAPAVPSNGGDMQMPDGVNAPDGADVDALACLAERKHWAVDELPPKIDVDILRCLDDRGWVEARIVTMQNRSKGSGDRTPPAPVRGGWFSPIGAPAMAGDWDKMVANRKRDAWNHPPEVRISERGRAVLSRHRLQAQDGGDQGTAGAKGDPAGALAGRLRTEAAAERKGVPEADEERLAADVAPRESPSPAAPDEAMLSPSGLLRAFGLPMTALNALNLRLQRFRQRNHNGWVENTEAAVNQARFLYRVSAVRHIVTALRDKRRDQQTTSKRR